MKLKIILLALIILFGLMAAPKFIMAQTAISLPEIEVLNQEIASRKDKIAQLEATMTKFKTIADQKQTEGISLKNQIAILDNRIAQAKADIDLNLEKLKQTELEIKKLDISIKEKANIIERQKQIVTSLIKNIHVADKRNYLEIMLTYKNFAEFFDELKNIETVYEDLGKSLKTIRLAKEQLDQKRSEEDNQRKNYLQIQLQLKSSQNKLQDQSFAKQNILIQTKNEERRYRTLLESQKAQYQVVENEIRTFENKIRKKLEEQDKIKPVGNVAMLRPVFSHVINATFHDPEYPFRNVFEHSGIDIKASQETPVQAVASGYVARARRCAVASCYSYILLVHTGHLSTLYGHLSQVAVNDDQFVNKGDLIGYSGGTPGRAGSGPFVTGPHLHFEVRLDGIPVDPLGYVSQ